MVDNIFLQVTILLSITVSVAFIIRLLKQPLIVAYITAGIVCGPLFLNLLRGDKNLYDAFAQFGIVLLLFLVGLNLNFGYIKKIGKVATLTGLGQVIFTSILGIIILLFIGFNWLPAIYLAVAITFSSTIVILKLLSNKKDTESVYGRYTIGLMLVQDVIAIVILVILGIIKQDGSAGVYLWELPVKGAVLFLIIYFTSRYLLPRLLDRIATSSEFLFIFTVAWCFAVSSLVYLAGFSIEIGAVIAGLSLGSSPYQPEIASRLKPLRDFFLVLFFIILGSEIGLSDWNIIFKPGILLSIFILIGNPFILYFLFRFFKFTRHNSFLVGLTAAQVSEFGFIVLFTGQQLGHIKGGELAIFTMVALITIFISSYLITYNEQLYRFFLPLFQLFGKDKYYQVDKKPINYDVWVFGYHRIGWKVCEALARKKIKFAVVDFNPDVITKLKHRGIPAFFGDAADVEFLEQVPLKKARMVISTIPELDDQRTLITHLRHLNKNIYIIASLYHTIHLEDLYKIGADYVIVPHLLGGHWIADILRQRVVTKPLFAKLRREQKEEMKLRFEAGVVHH